MEVKLITSEVIKAIKIIEKAKSALKIPILQFSKLVADSSGAFLVKSTIDTTIKYNLDGEVIQPGSLVLSSTSIIKKIKEGWLTFTDDCIYTDRKTINFANTIEPSEYPDAPEFAKDDFIFETTEEELKGLLVAKYAAAKDDTRPILKGVCFRKSEVCSLDGFRVSLRKGNYDNDSRSFIVPIDAINIINSVISKNNNPVKVYLSNDFVKFTIGAIEVTSALLQGDYIKYDQVIPKENKYHLTLNTKEMLEELDFINSFGEKHIKITFSEEELLIMIADENNSVKCKVNCIYNKTPYCKNNYFIPEFNIGFDGKFLAEAFKNSSGETVDILLSSPVSPVTILSGNNLELILPVRFKTSNVA